VSQSRSHASPVSRPERKGSASEGGGVRVRVRVSVRVSVRVRGVHWRVGELAEATTGSNGC